MLPTIDITQATHIVQYVAQSAFRQFVYCNSHAIASCQKSNCKQGISYLQCRDQVCRLQQCQLADLVHNCRNLGVCRCRGGIRLPSSLYPLLCSSNGRTCIRSGASVADAAPKGARCGYGHCELCIWGGRWDGWQSLCRAFLRFCGRQCTICGLAPWHYCARARANPAKKFEVGV